MYRQVQGARRTISSTRIQSLGCKVDALKSRDGLVVVKDSFRLKEEQSGFRVLPLRYRPASEETTVAPTTVPRTRGNCDTVSPAEKDKGSARRG